MKDDHVSRRSLLKNTLALCGAALVPGLFMSTAAQAAKAPKEAMRYQETPLADKKCLNCAQFVPGPSSDAAGSCKVVEGSISPEGYCIIWTPIP